MTNDPGITDVALYCWRWGPWWAAAVIVLVAVIECWPRPAAADIHADGNGAHLCLSRDKRTGDLWATLCWQGLRRSPPPRGLACWRSPSGTWHRRAVRWRRDTRSSAHATECVRALEPGRWLVRIRQGGALLVEATYTVPRFPDLTRRPPVR